MSKSKPASKSNTATLEMFILDVLRHDDVEQVDSIVRMLNDRSCIGWRDHWTHDFLPEEVACALEETVQQGWVQVLQEDSAGELTVVEKPIAIKSDESTGYWFHLTEAGRAAWGDWSPPENGEAQA